MTEPFAKIIPSGLNSSKNPVSFKDSYGRAVAIKTFTPFF